MLTIASISAEPLSIELTEPFGIATGTQHRADNVLVSLNLSDGTKGLGEAAPFPAVSGETSAQALEALDKIIPELIGKAANRWRPLCGEIYERMPDCPSAACALQSALLDAWLKSHRCSMWSFFGGAECILESDITLPTGGKDEAAKAAARAMRMGFRTLKVKVGAIAPELDAERLIEIARHAPSARLILDANGAYTADQALGLLAALGTVREQVALFEQPTAREDLDGLLQVLTESRIEVAADESARSSKDVLGLVRTGAASAVNIKLMKSGLVQSLEMIALAKAHGLRLMVGGMVESELAMSMSACVAGGLGGFHWVDLDTPLFMKQTPFWGGFERTGAHLKLDVIRFGHGVGMHR
jgi:L-Ala-D/L-Glu epimerase